MLEGVCPSSSRGPRDHVEMEAAVKALADRSFYEARR